MGYVAPWLATGGWVPFVRRLQQSRELELLSKLVGLPDLHQNVTLGKFLKGCGGPNTELDLKLTFWSGTLPYVLSGCASDDEVDAKACALKALQQWSGSVDEQMSNRGQNSS